MEIDRRAIGPTESPYFIAEAGVNHNGELHLAEDLIDAAADGADAVKFQTFSAERHGSPLASLVVVRKSPISVMTRRSASRTT